MQMEVLFGTHLKIGASCLGLALVEGPPDLRAVISNIWWLCRARRGSWGEGCSWGPAGAYLLSFSLWGGWGPEGHNSRAVALNGSKMTYQKKKKKVTLKQQFWSISKEGTMLSATKEVTYCQKTHHPEGEGDDQIAATYKKIFITPKSVYRSYRFPVCH